MFRETLQCNVFDIDNTHARHGWLQPIYENMEVANVFKCGSSWEVNIQVIRQVIASLRERPARNNVKVAEIVPV